MTTTPEYDAILARKMAERDNPKTLGEFVNLPAKDREAIGEPIARKAFAKQEEVKRKRGRPPGSKNRPKAK